MNLDKARTKNRERDHSAQTHEDGTLSAVRQMMREADAAPRPRREPRRNEPEQVPPRAGADLQHGAARMRPVGRGASSEPAAEVEVEAGATLSERLVERLRRYEPKKTHGFALMFLAMMIWSPWLIPGLLFLALWVVLIVYFTLGPDRVSELAVTFWTGFEKRRPETAQRLLGRIQRGADRVDGWLSWLPESWTDGLYLPDFGRSRIEESGETREALERDPFERLDKQREAATSEARQVPGMPLRS